MRKLDIGDEMQSTGSDWPPLTETQQQLAMSCWPLARWLAVKQWKRMGKRIPLDLLRAEASVRLVIAAQRFDPLLEIPFRGYATRGIRQGLMYVSKRTCLYQDSVRENESYFHNEIGDGYKETIHVVDRLTDYRKPSADHIFHVKSLLENVRGIVGPRTFEMMKLHYMEERSCEEIGQIFDLSRQRINMIIREACQCVQELMSAELEGDDSPCSRSPRSAQEQHIQSLASLESYTSED